LYCSDAPILKYGSHMCTYRQTATPWARCNLETHINCKRTCTAEHRKRHISQSLFWWRLSRQSYYSTCWEFYNISVLLSETFERGW